ncbi:protein inscuteable homolog [Pecten maximus]|uniref:protein inscuteable homolog n=1 Tax=Pecten maximus TaxID=6579 RepID=UPI0014590B73|nr:protein inscuteable homolog [Pecten maximus]
MLRHSVKKSTREKFIFDPTQRWLSDIRWSTETECMSVLQGKSLLTEMDKYSLHAAVVKNGIDTIRDDSHHISNEFTKLFKYVEAEKWAAVRSLVMQLTCHIRSLIQECNLCLPDPPSYILEQQETVMGECAKLAQQVDRRSSSSKDDRTPPKIPVTNQLTFLGQAFSRLVDLALGHLLQKVVETLDEANNPVTLSSALGTVVSLGLEGEHMCYIFAREGGVRALLDICRTESLSFIHPQTLRALATICCVAEGIFEIEKEGGVECLMDILCNYSNGEKVRGEVAGVLAQVTSPCLENFQQLSGLVENLDEILRALIGLCANTLSHEVFLLSSAAIANITFMDSMACDILLKYDAPRVLIQSCGTSVAQSLFAKDQVATVLANMVAVDNCRQCIINSGGLDLCLQLLQERPLAYKSPSEIAACERVQQKSAIALARLCREEEIAQIIVEMEGIPRLVELCRNKGERNNSDAVLVACLAALRKVSALYKTENIIDIDFKQLIQPRLMDSFLICTNTDENFV